MSIHVKQSSGTNRLSAPFVTAESKTFRIAAGTKIVTRSANTTAVAFMSATDVTNLLGQSYTSSELQVRTALCLSNGDGVAEVDHVTCTLKNGVYYACFDGTSSNKHPVRCQYILIGW